MRGGDLSGLMKDEENLINKDSVSCDVKESSWGADPPLLPDITSSAGQINDCIPLP